MNRLRSHSVSRSKISSFKSSVKGVGVVFLDACSVSVRVKRSRRRHLSKLRILRELLSFLLCGIGVIKNAHLRSSVVPFIHLSLSHTHTHTLSLCVCVCVSVSVLLLLK